MNEKVQSKQCLAAVIAAWTALSLASASTPITITHDEVQRVVQIDNGDSTQTLYTYDANGNRLSRLPIDNNRLITVTVDPPNSGTVTGDGPTLFNTQAVLSATPAGSFTFSGWYEANTLVSTSTPYTFTVDASRTLVAKFALPAPEIVVEDTTAATAVNLTDGSSTLLFVHPAPMSRTLTVRNIGTASLIGLSATINGPGSGLFSSTSLPAALAPGSSVTLTVQFTSSTPGISAAVLHILSNDPDKGAFDVNLSGSGVLMMPTFDEDLTFDDNQMPPGWTLGFPNGPGRNASIANQRFDVRQVDTYGALERAKQLPAGAAKVVVSYTGNITANYWGQSTHVQFMTSDGEFLALFGKAGYGAPSMNAVVRQEGTPAAAFERSHPLDTGAYRMTAVFEDSQITYTVTKLGANAPLLDEVVSVPALRVRSLQTLRLFSLTTTGDPSWIDDVSIRALPMSASESWRQQHFGRMSNTGDAADSAAPMHDGIPNLMKFATGMDAAKPGANPASSTTDGNNIYLSYMRSKAARNGSVDCFVEWNDDLKLASWSTAGVTEIAVDRGTTEEVTAAIPKGSGERRFVRLTVSGPITASTAPMGFNTVACLGNSDTRFSIPFHRPAVFQGKVESSSGNVIAVQGAPGWKADQFVYAAGTQPNRFYLEFLSGPKEGLSYTVTANDASSLAVDLNGDSIQGSVSSGDALHIVPYWSLMTMLPPQAGITGSGSISGSGAATRVFVPDLAAAGTNLAASSSYFYYSGAASGGPGWRKQGGGFASIRNDDPLPPETYVIIRQDGVAASAVLTGVGAVPITSAGATLRRYQIGTLRPGTAQDNAIALDIPLPLSLSRSNLYAGPGGAFAGTTSISGSSGDKLFIFDDSVAGRDKAASKSYYYYIGSSFGGPGWRLQGGGFSTLRDQEEVFRPGSGFIIRKEATPSPAGFIWNVPLTY